MNLYFAHSMEIYNTAESSRARRFIRKSWPVYKLIDPERLRWKALVSKYGEEGVYRHVILKSDFVVVLEYEDHIGRGVYAEVHNAIKMKKPVYVLRGKQFLKIVNVKYVGINWTLYGKLVLTDKQKHRPDVKSGRCLLKHLPQGE